MGKRKTLAEAEAEAEAYQACRWDTVRESLEDWRARLNETVAKGAGKSQKSVAGKMAADARTALQYIGRMEVFGIDAISPQLLDYTIKLGVVFERMRLRPSEPWIGRSPRVSRAAKVKGELSGELTLNEWTLVVAARERLVKNGFSRAAAGRRIGSQLREGTYPDIDRIVRIENNTIETKRLKR